MKPFPIISSVLSLGLMFSTPALAHVGHGDEFQGAGGVQRVAVNAATDQQMGIVVTPITQAAPSGSGVMIPATALVDAEGKQLAFVKYENFYEPVEVTTGQTQGDLIEITQGLSTGEQLVTQGGLMLYAQSRKTQAPTTAASPGAIAPQPNAEHEQAHAQGKAHSHDKTQAAGEGAQQNNLLLKIGIVAAVGVGALLVAGVTTTLGARKKKGTVSNKEGGI